MKLPLRGERAERATAQIVLNVADLHRLSPTSWALGLRRSRSWGFATLHPRLYAVASFAG
ncbi:MAG: hypothetical protein QOJ64_869 [Acidobacteriota bacterium]|jgi:hypothetical protein|nr:hypothetical protein [Acidobacteriota bacterium]